MNQALKDGWRSNNRKGSKSDAIRSGCHQVMRQGDSAPERKTSLSYPTELSQLNTPVPQINKISENCVVGLESRLGKQPLPRALGGPEVVGVCI